MKQTIRIGTRKSALALWQANWCATALTTAGFHVEVVELVTQGDITTGSLRATGGDGLFTKRIQQALLDGEVDLAVHSLKDLPTDPVADLCLAAVPPREATADALLSRARISFEELPPGSVIGTGSVRRQAQLWHARPDLSIVDIRGNVDTRIKRLEADEYDAIVLAEAGLRRLGLEARITQLLPMTWMLPAVGQGALGIEARQDDDDSIEAALALNDEATHRAVVAERALLNELCAGCLAPVGCLAVVDHDRLSLRAVVLSPDGKERLSVDAEGASSQSETIGREAASRLLQQGADALVALSRD